MPWTSYIWTRDESESTTTTTTSSSSSSSSSSSYSPPPLSRFSVPLEHYSTITGLPLHILLPTVLLTTLSLTSIRLYKSHLRRVPTATHIPPSFLRRRSLYGYVSSVGDGDNFRLFHTPGGRWAGWGWLPSRKAYLPLPSSQPVSSGVKGRADAGVMQDKAASGLGVGARGAGEGGGGGGGGGGAATASAPAPVAQKAQKLETIHVRMAGVDAPELAHFGRPSQPHGKESLDMLKALVSGKYVRVYLYRKDQYERVVAGVYIRSPMPVLIRPMTGMLERAPLVVRVLLSPVEAMLRVLGWSWNLVRGRRMTDVSLKMLEEGAAGVYEAKFGSEFGGEEKEKLYREAEAEAKRRGVGMWGGKEPSEEARGWWSNLLFSGDKAHTKLETPREFKTRMKVSEEGKAKK